ncbi:MAG: hypothetical protein ACP5G2_06315, partial [Candidatus Bipolaricaulaceae bacterium]
MRNGRWFIAFLLSTGLAGSAAASVARISGTFGMDGVMRRIPATLTGEIKADTPSEFALIELALRSNVDLRADYGWVTPRLDAAVNMAGVEHFMFGADVDVRDIDVYGGTVDRISLSPEMWFAVPFEAVTDVNNLPNAVVVPSGDLLFVTARVTGAYIIGGCTVRQVVMVQDVNFPAPGTSFAPLCYPVQSQSFATGSLMSISWRAPAGFHVSLNTGLDASWAGSSVKGYSAVGSVDPGSSFARVTFGGISIGDIQFYGQQVRGIQLQGGFEFTTGGPVNFVLSGGVSGQ